jgi:hypothetical protein
MGGGDFRYRGATFRPGNFDIPSSVDVAILQRAALITSPRPQASSRASMNFRQVASIVPEWMPRSLVTPRQFARRWAPTAMPAFQRCASRSIWQQ